MRTIKKYPKPNFKIGDVVVFEGRDVFEQTDMRFLYQGTITEAVFRKTLSPDWEYEIIFNGGLIFNRSDNDLKSYNNFK